MNLELRNIHLEASSRDEGAAKFGFDRLEGTLGVVDSLQKIAFEGASGVVEEVLRVALVGALRTIEEVFLVVACSARSE